MLLESYQADKSWAGKGAARSSEPQDIRAGRLVIELYDKEVGNRWPPLLAAGDPEVPGARAGTCAPPS